MNYNMQRRFWENLVMIILMLIVALWCFLFSDR
jgi:hypothetical protein